MKYRVTCYGYECVVSVSEGVYHVTASRRGYTVTFSASDLRQVRGKIKRLRYAA